MDGALMCIYTYTNKKNIRIFSMFKGHVIFKRIHTPPFSVVSLCLVLFVKKNKTKTTIGCQPITFSFSNIKNKIF